VLLPELPHRPIGDPTATRDPACTSTLPRSRWHRAITTPPFSISMWLPASAIHPASARRRCVSA